MEKKKQDFIFLLILMIASFISYNILGKLSQPDSQPSPIEILATIILIGWYITLYRVTSNFYSNKWIRGAYASLLILQFTLNAYVILQVNTPISELVVPASIAYVVNLMGFSIVFYLLLKDIFSQKHDLVYSLLGASSIYFMIPIIFAYIYCLVAVQNPSLVNADPLEIRTLLFNCIDYSWFIVAGIDYSREKIGDIIQTIAILESISANLFIVFIIGRLMSK